MSKVVRYTPYLNIICPNCNKEAETLRLDSKRLQIRDTFYMFFIWNSHFNFPVFIFKVFL